MLKPSFALKAGCGRAQLYTSPRLSAGVQSEQTCSWDHLRWGGVDTSHGKYICWFLLFHEVEEILYRPPAILVLWSRITGRGKPPPELYLQNMRHSIHKNGMFSCRNSVPGFNGLMEFNSAFDVTHFKHTS